MLEGLEPEVQLYRYTVEQFLGMAEAGILPERGVELIEGLLVEMSPEVNNRHGETRRILAEMLLDQRHGRYAAYPSLSLRLGPRDMVDPDFVLVRLPQGDLSGEVSAADVALIIEVAGSSLDYDLREKRERYAAARIPEYWVIDLQSDLAHVFWDPRGDGYDACRVAAIGETIAPREFPDVSVDLAQVFV